ncbi:MAG: S9 family peptidase [Candidatus Krumholzibacteriota bacterium]|nr:S9 family peptidase [Candidatus Krumholzibacteriota bacterium]
MRRSIEFRAVLVILAILSALFIPAPGAFSATPEAAPQDSSGAEPDKTPYIQIGEWLVLGPVTTTLPAFHQEEKTDNDSKFLLSFGDMRIDAFKPVGKSVEYLPLGGSALWTPARPDTDGVHLDTAGNEPLITYLASYIETHRWTKIEMEVSGSDPFELYIDGRSAAKSLKERTGKTRHRVSATENLKQGKHLVVVKTVYMPADSVSVWSFDARIRPGEGFDTPIKASIDPSAPLDISNILDVNNIGSIDLSPDGKLALISYWRFLPPDGERESWREIRSLPEGTMVRMLDDSRMRNVGWAPSGHRLSYSFFSNGAGSIKILDLESGRTETVLEGIKDLGGYLWSPDETYMIYYVEENYKEDPSGIKRLRGIEDRTDYARNRTSTYLTSVPGGTTRKIATGKHDIFVYDIHPDGQRLLVQKGYEDLEKRPFFSSQLLILDLNDMSTSLLWEGQWLNNAAWSPDGSEILITGGPSTFGKDGKNIADGLIPNDYDHQLYIFSPETKKARPITREFDPAVQRAVWSEADGNIYIVAESGSYVKCYRFDPRKSRFNEFDFGVDVISRGDISDNSLSMVFSGSGADQPAKLYYANLKNGKAKEIYDPDREMMENVRLGKIENWDFISEKGVKIVGRVHYPPDFDAEKKYPCIVYYYGGTSPVNRAFGGRYPKNLWAAKGYVVYVLQPSGATGFGQEFSTAHVNDWGKTTAEEIIFGTKEFLQAHPFVNPCRVGCIGASYGGFMTQLLITKTDLFAAAISHAGISMIPSYWGEGYWGYAYNAVSAAGSYPWNRPDIYVDQSPLFAADKITTPLLLLHGGSDTNVPPGESEQMYTALKVLGKEVEYIKYSGQNHFILDYKKRISWSDAQLAWFDKWLKDQPEWWNETYPPLKDEKKKEPEKVAAEKIDLGDDTVVLMGEVTREEIIEGLDGWDSEFFAYEPDEATIAVLEEKIYGVEILCVLGTWCPDSRREIPRLWKILEKMEYPVSEIRMLAVGSSRFTIDMPIPARLFNWSRDIRKWFDVERVATIIILRDGSEIGRIVETPSESLEKDLLAILSDK